MTPEQRRIARHALGLSLHAKQPYRNHYSASIGAPITDEWRALCDLGLAVHVCTRESEHVYALTVRGALAAMEPHERLSAELLREMVEHEDRAKAGGGS